MALAHEGHCMMTPLTHASWRKNSRIQGQNQFTAI